VLVAAALFAGIVVVLLLGWAVSASPLPEWLKFVLYTFLASFLGGGATARRRYRAGKSPWSLKEPERG
jgi:hypothetical protein